MSDEHPYTNTPEGRVALRLLIAAGMKRWVGSGGDLPVFAIDDWMAIMEPLTRADAAVVVLRVLHGLELTRIAELLGTYRQLADQCWRRAAKTLRDERNIGPLRAMFESHSAPKGRHKTSYRRKSRTAKLGDENSGLYFDSLRASAFYDRLFGEKRAD